MNVSENEIVGGLILQIIKQGFSIEIRQRKFGESPCLELRKVGFPHGWFVEPPEVCPSLVKTLRAAVDFIGTLPQ